MQSIYENGTYLKNNPSWHEEDSLWKAEQILKIISRNNLAPTTVGEIGCGAGEILYCLSERLSGNINFFGYEISPQALEICQGKSKKNLHFFLQNLLEKEDDNIFDIIMAIDVIEHVEDYLGFLKKFKSKGKYKIFHIPLDLSVQGVLRCSPLMQARKSIGHIHYFTTETALATLEDTGYKILDYFYTRGSLELPNRGWKATLLSFPRKALFSINQDLAVRILGGFSLMVLSE